MNTAAPPLGLIAGLGGLPVAIADAARSAGRDICVIRVEGFEEPALAEYPGQVVNIGEMGRCFDVLRAAQCEDVVFAGYVHRPDLSTLKLDEIGAGFIQSFVAAGRTGDDTLLRALISVFERHGFRILGAETVAQRLLAEAGQIAGPAPSDSDLRDLRKAFRVAGLIGAEDIGQACVVRGGIVLAVEAQEGTDAMLARVGDLRNASHRKSDTSAGVLVKRAKPGQERRIDLPVIGPATIEAAARAGLAGIGLEASGALIVERERVVADAEAQGLFIVGLDPADARWAR